MSGPSFFDWNWDEIDSQVAPEEERAPVESGPPATEFSAPVSDRMIVNDIWEEAEVIDGNDPALWRKDPLGAWINRQEYGRRNSQFGWEIREARGGRLEAVQWQNCLDQAASATQSRVTSEGLRNRRSVW